MDKLLPCPFCGSDELGITSTAIGSESEYYINCLNCGAEGPITEPGYEEMAEEADRLWNTRSCNATAAEKQETIQPKARA